MAKRLEDGTLVEVLPDGSTRPFPEDGTDWSALARLMDDEIDAAALSDPDNQPRTRDSDHLYTPAFGQMIKLTRRRLRLTQEDFAERFEIPLGTLRDWEQGKTIPDQAARAYLRVIARDPGAVEKALTRSMPVEAEPAE
ncbi:MAG: helix-turn-helix domain-containing protein [Hyphomicrobiaceae bacterium]